MLYRLEVAAISYECWKYGRRQNLMYTRDWSTTIILYGRQVVHTPNSIGKLYIHTWQKMRNIPWIDLKASYYRDSDLEDLPSRSMNNRLVIAFQITVDVKSFTPSCFYVRHSSRGTIFVCYKMKYKDNNYFNKKFIRWILFRYFIYTYRFAYSFVVWIQLGYCAYHYPMVAYLWYIKNLLIN